jgi:hypothetical protein
MREKKREDEEEEEEEERFAGTGVEECCDAKRRILGGILLARNIDGELQGGRWGGHMIGNCRKRRVAPAAESTNEGPTSNLLLLTTPLFSIRSVLQNFP